MKLSRRGLLGMIAAAPLAGIIKPEKKLETEAFNPGNEPLMRLNSGYGRVKILDIEANRAFRAGEFVSIGKDGKATRVTGTNQPIGVALEKTKYHFEADKYIVRVQVF